MSNVTSKAAKKIKNANKKLFGFARLQTIDPFFLEENELETARIQHEQMTALLSGSNLHAIPSRKDFIEGEITIQTKKGSYVAIGQKYDAFVPLSEVGDLTVGERGNFWVMSNQTKEGMVTLSHVQAQAWEKLKEISENGEHVEARVFALAMDRRSQRVSGVRIVFEDASLKGIRGFIPNTELAIGSDPRNMVDSVITAKVQGVDPHKGGEFGYVVLSQRDAAKDIASKHIASFTTGDIVSGTVLKFIKASVNDKDMSVLVNIGNGVTGLIYRTEVTGYPRRKANDVLKVGEEIEVEVTKVQPELQRISLSMKALGKKRTLSALEPGLIVEGDIVNTASYGFFVHIGGGVEGLLHVSDLANEASGKKESFKIGDHTQVVVLSIGENGARIALGRRQVVAAAKK
ncbi:MAG: S1 RNA-binding domain-containing protein [Candidatus Melainabacteria bacterium]|nr:S1 RNA-binding domain-containing protein [Candidatus Melainabacteria bacterium]